MFGSPLQIKKCPKCGIVKDVLLFSSNKSKRDGRSTWCKMCMRIIISTWAFREKDRIKENKRIWWKKNYSKCLVRSRAWKANNREKARDITRKWRDENPEKSKEASNRWKRNNKEKASLVCKKWAEKNREHIRENNRKYSRKRDGTITGRLNSRMSKLIRYSLIGRKQNRHWGDFVDFSVEELTQHLERQFKDGMSWERFLKGEIHIDHIIPKSVFNYEKPEDDDFKRCWSLKNLQPLWALDNIKKNNRLEKPFQPTLIFKGDKV